MASMIKKFNIDKSHINRGFSYGCNINGDEICIKKDSDYSAFFFKRIDSGEDDTNWGRLTFKKDVTDDTVFTVYAFAANKESFAYNNADVKIDDYLLNIEIKLSEKLAFFFGESVYTASGFSDVLLNEVSGRFLWLMLEVKAATQAKFYDFKVYSPSNNFLQTFPEVYQTNGDFFNRYISIFSSIYNDLQDKIDTIDKIIDVNTAPYSLLKIFATWLGIELDGDFLSEDELRKLIMAYNELNSSKGSKKAIRKIIEIIVSEPYYIVEQKLVGEYLYKENKDLFVRLYGDNANCFCVLINCPSNESLHAKLMYILKQFCPLRTKIKIVFLGNNGALDDGSYIDINARMVKMKIGKLGSDTNLKGKNILA